MRRAERAPLDVWVFIRVSLNTIERAVSALRDSMTRRHHIATHMDDGPLEKRLRHEADADYEAAEELKKALRDGERKE
jgi:hypothetical protein